MTTINELYFEKVMTAIILIFLVVLSFLLLKPILLSIIFGLILAFVFTPVYQWFYKKTKSKNLSASIIIAVLILSIFLSIWFLTPILITQSFKIFQATLQIDFVSTLKGIFPGFFSSPQFSNQISSVFSSFLTNTSNSITNSLTNMLLDLPALSMQILVVLFTFFFVLRDQEQISDYIKSLLPFPKEVENKLFKYSSEITKSVLYGQVIIGIIQGLVAGIGFFIFGVPNALFLTLLAAIMGILPILGTPIVWAPVAIYMFIAGNNTGGWGIVVFGVISSTIDNILRPLFIARRTSISSAIILISMIGGLFFFGLLGFVIGPLVIAYLLIILELYRKKPTGLIIHEDSKK